MPQFIMGALFILAVLNPSATISIMAKTVETVHNVMAPIVIDSGKDMDTKKVNK